MTTKTATQSRKAAPAAKAAPVAKTPAKAAPAATATEWVAPIAKFDWAAAIEKTGKSLNALCAEAGGPAKGANPSQIRRLLKGEVARVERGRAEEIARLIGTPFAKVWGPVPAS